MNHSVATGFDADLTALLPSLRTYARSLTHDRDRADDLVQETAAKALAARASFQPGTNLAGWLCRIQRNAFISGMRRQHPTTSLDEVDTSAMSHPPHQESGLAVREFMGAFRRLSADARKTLLLAGVEGQGQKQIAERCGVSVGTVKSRTSRARAALEEMLADKHPGASPASRPSGRAVNHQ